MAPPWYIDNIPGFVELVLISDKISHLYPWFLVFVCIQSTEMIKLNLCWTNGEYHSQFYYKCDYVSVFGD